MKHDPGCLYVVATPIGNLADLSGRAAEILRTVDLVAAEDTRHSGRLLAHIGAHPALQSLHEHNEREVVPSLVRRLQGGARIALIADAGTPLISDPGYILVGAARRAGVQLFSVPGPCAAIAALAISGLASDRFVFEGFLPARASARRKRLAVLATEARTVICYESSHRVVAAVRDIAAICGYERPLALARELTKLHEQSVQLPAAALADWLTADDNRRRGEFVLLLAGAEPAPTSTYAVDLELLLTKLLANLLPREAARIATELTGAPRNRVYDLALALSRR